MLDRGSVFVWEWQDETLLWRPYSPQVAYYIEQVVRETPKSSSVSLGEADASLTPYILDLISMNQFRLDTGTLYPVRRVNFPHSSAPGRGIVWEWEELPHQWVPFETRLSILIQDALERQQTSLSLGEPCNGSHICFQTMTQIEFPSQKRNRVRARAQMSYPKAGNKCSSAQYHIALPQYLNAYSNSKHRSFTVQQQHTGSSHALVNVQQERVNGNHGLLNSRQRTLSNNQEIAKINQGLMNANQGLVNVNRGLPNSNQGLMNSNHFLVNANHVPMNSHQRIMNRGQEPLCSSYGMVDPSLLLQNSRQELLNANQITVNFNSGAVNYSAGTMHSNHGIVNSNDGLVNYNQDPEDNSHELINFDANVILPNYGPSSYCETTSDDSSPESGSPNLMLLDSDISPQWAPVQQDYSIYNSSHALARSNSRRSNSRTGLARSESRCRGSRPELARSESRPGDYRPALSRANSRPEEHQAVLHRSESRPVESRPVLLRSNSGPNDYKPGFMRSNSRPAHPKPGLVRSDSKFEFSASDIRPSDFRPALSRSDSRYNEIRPAAVKTDCRNVGCSLGYVRSPSRPEDSRPELLRSQSRSISTDSKPSLASPHHRINHAKPNLAGRSLSRSVSLKGSRSPPPCACPHCLLLQSVKSASWPGRQLDSKPAKAQPYDSQRCEKSKGLTRVPPVPLGNIEGSGMIPPALAEPCRSRPHRAQRISGPATAVTAANTSNRVSLETPDRLNVKLQAGRVITTAGREAARQGPLSSRHRREDEWIFQALGISGLLMSAAGLPVCLSIPATPIFHPPPVKKKHIRPVPGIQGSSRKISNKKSKKPEEMIKQFLQRVKTPLSEDCALCDQTMTDGEVGRLYHCSHAYHVRCLAPLYKDGTLRCPTCQTLYGVKIGSQPPGKMSFHIIPHSLPGYSEFETIRIIYHIPPGVQGPGQPHPGMKFTAPDFPLHCYLPNTKKGREILLLLIKAWEKRLLFPVLPSRTPGVLDSVSISRIPLKTEFGSNITGKGFPDSRYLDSVLRQLRDWGVSSD